MRKSRIIWALLLVAMVLVIVAALAEDSTQDVEPHEHFAFCSDKTVCAECGQPYKGNNIEHPPISNVYYSDENSHWCQCACSEQKFNPESHRRPCDGSTCVQCGASYNGDQLEHRDFEPDPAYDAYYHWKVCGVCGAKADVEEHVRDCRVQFCSSCPSAYDGENKTHEFSQYQSKGDEHWKECTCGEAKGEPERHSVLCSAPDYCTVCKQTVSGGQLTHIGSESGVYASDDDHHWLVCDGCHEQYQVGEHQGGEQSGICAVCGRQYREAIEPDPEETPDPDATETPDPDATETPDPDNTTDPDATETPDPDASATPEPEDTTDPEPSDTPEPEDTTDPEPSATPEPEDTTDPEPSATPEPEDTTDPEPSVTPEPEDTTAPEPSATTEPDVSPEPDVTEEPGETEAPADTELPEVTETPGPVQSDEPDASATPEPSTSPDPTSTPARSRKPWATATPALTGDSFVSRFRGNSDAAANGDLLAEEVVSLTMEADGEEPGYEGSVLTVYPADFRDDGVRIRLSSRYGAEMAEGFAAWQDSIGNMAALRATEAYRDFVALTRAMVQSLLPEKTVDEVDTIIILLLRSRMDGALEEVASVAFDEDIGGEIAGHVVAGGYEIFLVLRDGEIDLLVR